MLPEAILCTREVGESARKAAYELLTAMCEALIIWRQPSDINGMYLSVCPVLRDQQDVLCHEAIITAGINHL